MDKSSNYSMIFRQEADSFKGSFISEQSFRGKISEFHIWNYTLSENIIKEISNCKSALKGNIVSWDTEYIIFHSVNPEHTNIEIVLPMAKWYLSKIQWITKMLNIIVRFTKDIFTHLSQSKGMTGWQGWL